MLLLETAPHAAEERTVFCCELTELNGLSGDLMGPGADVVCASCAQPTSPVFLEDVIVDLCTSCGAMWLDEGELSALSLGRFEG